MLRVSQALEDGVDGDFRSGFTTIGRRKNRTSGLDTNAWTASSFSVSDPSDGGMRALDRHQGCVSNQGIASWVPAYL
ncbi:hypothetical protein ACH5RR_012933 [Cinchona calisaya]|uniref:Uncharacterized protein n=1 Tax=Cinchona calisaya TaxID=153742 RepID=A0ABD3A0U0_9GENT